MAYRLERTMWGGMLFIFVAGVIVIFIVLGVAMSRESKSIRKKNVENLDQLMDETFDGSVSVLFSPSITRISLEEALPEAERRGYKLLSPPKDAMGKAVFEKI